MPAKTLVTGGSGFVGSNLKCIRPDFLYPTRSELDLSNREAIRNYIRNNDIINIIHLAGDVGGIGYNKGHQATLMANNLEIGFNILMEAKEAKCNIIMVGTTCSYPSSPKTIPFIEDELFDGMPERTNSGYGVAKRTLIKLSMELNSEFGLNVVNLIPTNMYGSFDNFSDASSHVIPAILKKFENNKDRIDIWGDGHATRDFLHVSEFIKALLIVLENIDRVGSSPINIGSGNEISIRDLVYLIRSVGNYTAIPVFSGNSSMNGQQRRVLDITRANSVLRWVPTISLAEGLLHTIRWYRENNK